MNENFNEGVAELYVTRIAATFAFGLPEHEQKKRIQAILHEVFTLGRGLPHKAPEVLEKSSGRVTVRKKRA